MRRLWRGSDKLGRRIAIWDVGLGMFNLQFVFWRHNWFDLVSLGCAVLLFYLAIYALRLGVNRRYYAWLIHAEGCRRNAKWN